MQAFYLKCEVGSEVPTACCVIQGKLLHLSGPEKGAQDVGGVWESRQCLHFAWCGTRVLLLFETSTFTGIPNRNTPAKPGKVAEPRKETCASARAEVSLFFSLDQSCSIEICYKPRV